MECCLPAPLFGATCRLRALAGAFVVPGPDVRGAWQVILGLEIKAPDCMQDPSPARCSRPDIQARYYLKWLDEIQGTFESSRSWGGSAPER